jgi:hypothetical protein
MPGSGALRLGPIARKLISPDRWADERGERSAGREGRDNPAPVVESELFFGSASGKEVQMQFVDPLQR